MSYYVASPAWMSTSSGRLQGGANVPHEKRSFAQDRALAADAGRKGGRAVAPEARSFSANRDLASEAGRKGGRAAQSERRRRVKEAYNTKRADEL